MSSAESNGSPSGRERIAFTAEYFDEKWSRLEELIQNKHKVEEMQHRRDNQGFSVQKYEHGIYLRKRDELLNSLEGTIGHSKKLSHWKLLLKPMVLLDAM